MSRTIARLRARCSKSARGDAGFTLVELLVAVIIQGLIMGALAMAFVGIMRGSTQAKGDLDKTGDARIAAQYIVSDARNSSGPELSLSDTASCPDPNPPVAGTPSPVVRFNWDGTGSAGGTTANTVNYVLVGNSLLRRQCVGGALVSDRAVASSVQSVSVSCSPTADCSGTPTSITVTVTSTAEASGSSYEYSLTGTFRKLIGTGPPITPKSLILLGTGGSCSGGTTGISLSNNASMRVYGDAYINTADGSSCAAMSLANGSSYAAGGTEFLTGGTCSAGNTVTCPTSGSYPTPLIDPYASLTPPSTSGMPTRTGCSAGVALPGLYASGFTVSGTCSLTSGVYVVQNGFTLSNNSTLTTGAGGVLIYLMSGTFTSNNGASLSLTAATSGSYSGVAFWQAAADTNGITISNNGAFTVNGAFYAPKANLTLSNNSITPYVTSLVVQSVTIGNNGNITIGAPSTTPLSITSTSPLQGWTVNRTGYSKTLAADGGDGLYVWSATALPAGMSINASSGVISGTPTSTGTSTVAVTLRDENGDTPASKNLSITINSAPSISTTSPLTNGEVGASYSRAIAGSGGTTPYSWSATGLPAGLSMSSGGVISGTPTATGTSTVNVTLTDATGATVSKSLSLQIVSAVSISTASLPNGARTVAYSQTVSASGGQTAYSWSATGLPAGLSIASGTGVISGTPTASGSFTVNVTVTDALGGTDTNSFPLTISPQPTISSVTLINKSGGIAGRVEQGDSIRVVFSTAMKVSRFCSTWSNDASDQVLNGDNQVTVTLTNGTSDPITVSSTGCTFNFGSIALGSNSYTSSTRTFKGTGSNKSMITWTASTRTLLVTLGAASGSTSTVASSTPVYTASGSIQDSAGATLGNSPFTLSNGQQF